eukprot:CAMPEP_0119121774 /NCGR_PEP_ID=MMETSP1310-20130426/2248_1 /TAXON_ID=464262 /ORGANISM="Genus nov. species nov., Strain RCC2339" /LENGTH=260 /DNA_ID=CAMNT_0007111353 /DNA_START=18 /DNA_END=796 /DNA_ORIENTATION=+
MGSGRREWVVVVLVLVFVLVFAGFGQGNDEPIPPEPILLDTVACYTSVAPTTPIVINVYENWSPIGAQRFLELVDEGYYDNSPLFRVVKNPSQIVQFGISLDKALEAKWGKNNIKDDPNMGFPFKRGYVSFAGGGKDSRATQAFFALSTRHTRHLGKVPHETPFGKVVSGMDVVDMFFDGDGKFSMDMEPWGQGPQQGRIMREGRKYLDEHYPDLSYFTTCTRRGGKAHHTYPEHGGLSADADFEDHTLSLSERIARRRA